MTELPIDRYREEIETAVAKDGSSLILSAAPGSGKSTRVPAYILNAKESNGIVAVLQPRRSAARMLAHHVAKLENVEVGEEIGYHVRGDKNVKPHTRLCYYTEGVFLRLMSNDSFMKSLYCIILDEFHERHLESDLVIARVKQLQELGQVKPRLVVMSATLNTAPLRSYLNSKVIECEAKPFPLELNYEAAKQKQDVCDHAAALVTSILHKKCKGDILVFMPGKFEIQKTIRIIEDRNKNGKIRCLALYGGMTLDAQAKVLSENEQQRVIVSTNLAETSLTIPGVRTVVDSGLVKVLRHDISKGLNTLKLEKISRDSADQRAGRSARLGPGLTIRLWSKQEQAMRPPFSDPEVKRIDLCEAILQLKLVNIELNSFPWFEKPEASALKSSLEFLKLLSALDKKEEITELGKSMVSLPLHPRLAKLVIEGALRGVAWECCLLAAYVSSSQNQISVSEHELEQNSCRSELFQVLDVIQRERKYYSITQEAREIQSLLKKIKVKKKQSEKIEPSVLKSILSAYPDRLSQRLPKGGGHYRFASGGGGVIEQGHPFSKFKYLLPLTQSMAIGKRKITMSGLSVIKDSWLEELFAQDFRVEVDVVWDEKKNLNIETRRRHWQNLILEETIQELDNIDKATHWIELIIEKKWTPESWTDEVEEFLLRCQMCAKYFPEKEILEFEPEDLQILLEEVIESSENDSRKLLNHLDYLFVFRNALSYEDLIFLDKMMPSHYQLKKRKVKIDYTGERPRLKAKIQDFYDTEYQPSIADGRINLLLDMLAPNFRVVQVTEDLPGFWKGSYQQIKKDLYRRYPKHEWR